MVFSTTLVLSALAFSLPAAAQVPPATPGCAERGGCRDIGPSEGSRERESREDDTPAWFRQSRRLYNDSIDQIHAGDFEAAQAAVLQALRLDSSFGKARYQYAWLLMIKGRCGDAIEQANSVSGSDAGKANELIGYCREQIRDEQAARAQSYGKEIGGVDSLQGEVFWVAPDGRHIQLRADSRVYLNERLVTGPGAHLVIKLADDTKFTLQRNSDMVLDDFVYDPNTSIGLISARLTKGVFRFVSGKMKKEPNVWNERIVIEGGVYGIRGTDLEVHIVADDFHPVNGCDEKGICKDYKVLSAAILRSGEVNFKSNKDGLVREIHSNGHTHLITSDGPVIELQP
jgi:hypothetical protein